MNEKNFREFELSNEIIDSLSKLAYDHPTEVQSQVIPLMLAKRDLVVKSQTGSGKTASYAIPICESIDWLENKPQALILTPTRELAAQVKDDFINIGRYKRMKATVKSGVAIDKRILMAPMTTNLSFENGMVTTDEHL